MKRISHSVAVAAVLAGGIGAAATGVELARTSLPALQAQDATSDTRPAAGPAVLASTFRSASRAAFPAVVFIRAESAPRTVSAAVPEGLRGTPYEEMFGGRSAPRRPENSSGSGFIISQDGYIVTNNHVVEGSSRVTVVLTDKREFDARVVGRDPNTDVAVLKVEAKGLPTVRLGDSDGLETGDWVLALGYPLSLGETTTAGIVSAKGKSIGIIDQSLRQAGRESHALEHFIQTDAVINPGNSGGPLIDLEGRVVGINSAIASPTGYYNGYGFAVPISLARRVADDLIRFGAVHRPIIGVQIREASLADAEVFRLPSPHGAVVASAPTGPAKSAGVQLGDVIVAVDGKPVRATGDLMERIARKQPGDRVSLDIIRYGERHRLGVELGTLEARRAPEAQRARAAQGGDAGRLGFGAQEIDPASAARLRLPFRDGVVVTGVDPMGPATAVAPGMRIERLNGRPIEKLEDLESAAARLRAGDVVSILGTLPTGSQTIANFRLRG